MNIGSIKQNEGGIFVGKIETLTIAMTIALREVHSANPKAPKFEVLALSASRAWVQVGALFELFSNGTGEAFLNGKIEDPSLAAPLYISAFRQEDGSYNVVWSRPTRRRDLASEMARKADDALPPLPGEGETAGAPAQGAEAGLGQSSAEHAFGGEQPEGGRRQRRQRTAEQVEEPETVS
ncbi:MULTISPECIES: DUF736 domain-containing protein [Sphingomonadales]|nr:MULTISPECIES: DUF736 domain-containing protein [Sphingomonadaceae]EPR16794.1 hypothetical protein M527_19470 [Sphingobium indicum IP26]EZP70234.1 hypothetical protein BV96_03477 [Sphingomonas paucimobilis]MBW7950558.1 DUF736 domain-containing protein [Pseudorhodoplanes sp.]AGH51908.1 hypothetical protein G432_21145 [Sphingomonas sp. MM-1]AMK20600.1 hypothetical protein K663_21218 [Sphingobium sp. MI1205]